MDIIRKWTESSFILKILIGIVIGAALGVFAPGFKFIGFLEKLEFT